MFKIPDFSVAPCLCKQVVSVLQDLNPYLYEQLYRRPWPFWHALFAALRITKEQPVGSGGKLVALALRTKSSCSLPNHSRTSRRAQRSTWVAKVLLFLMEDATVDGIFLNFLLAVASQRVKIIQNHSRLQSGRSVDHCWSAWHVAVPGPDKV